MYQDGKQIAELNFDDIGRPDTPYPFVLMVPQWAIEAILVDDLKRQGVEIEHNVEVTGFVQSAEGVVVEAKDKAGTSLELRGAYLLGADGAQYRAQKARPVLPGAPYPQGFLLADCKIDWPLDYEHMKFFIHGAALRGLPTAQGARDLPRDRASVGNQRSTSGQPRSRGDFRRADFARGGSDCAARGLRASSLAARGHLDDAVPAASSRREQVSRRTSFRRWRCRAYS